MINNLTSTFAVCTMQSFQSYLEGNLIISFKVLLIFMALDIVSGLMKAVHNRNLRSFIMSWGILKKGGLILSVILSLLLDELVNGGTPSFGTLMTWVAIGNEGLSILENLDALGVKIPEPIRDKLLDISETNEESKSEIEQLYNKKQDEVTKIHSKDDKK